MARRTTSAAKSPNARSAAAQEATPVATAAMPSSASARPAQSSASPSGIISDHGSQCQTTPTSHTCRQSSGTAAPPPDSPDFCPSYLRRRQVLEFFAKLEPTKIGLEACGAAHYWARVLRALGHEAVPLPPQYIKPYVKRGKNDALDAEAICEAMSRPGMRFVPVKSAEQQAALMLLRTRELLVKQRTMLINAMRGHAAEFGVVAAKGLGKVSELLQRAHAEGASVPTLALEMLNLLASQFDALELRLKTIEAKLMAWHKADPVSQCLATQPGIGPIGAVSFALKVTDPKAFRSSRHFAAWLG